MQKTPKQKNNDAIETPESSRHSDVRHVEQLTAKVSSAMVWLGSTTVVWQTLTWILTIFTARILSPTDYGLFGLAETLLPYLALASQLNVTTWVIHTNKLTLDNERTVFTLTVLLGLTMTLVGLSLAPLAADFYGNHNLLLLLQVVSIGFVLHGLSAVPYALLQRELRFKPIALMNLTLGVSGAVLTLALAIGGAGYWALVAGLLFRNITGTIWLIAVRGLPRGFGWDISVIRRAMKFGLPATGAYFFYMIYTTADDIVVGKLLGVEILGFYVMAFFLIDMPTAKLNEIVRRVFITYFSRLQNHRSELISAFFKAVKGYALITTPVFVGVGLVAAEAVPLVLGDKWAPMIYPLTALCAFALIRSLTDNIVPLLLALGHPGKELFVNLVGIIVLPVSFYFLCRQYQLDGILLALLVIYPIIPLLLLRTLKHLLGISAGQYIANLKAPLTAASIMGFVVITLGYALAPMLAPIWLLSVKVIVGALTYLGALWLIFRQEMFDILTFFSRRKEGA